MTITIQLSPEAEKGLERLARERGQEPALLARDLLEQRVCEPPMLPCPDGVGNDEPSELDRAIARLIHRTPDEIEAARQRLSAVSERGRPLPPGQSVFDAIWGKWPGDESDEEVARALAELS